MSSAELPAWVLDLVYRLDRAEEEHPQFFRYAGPPGSRNAYEQVETCYMAELLDLVPDEVLSGVRLAARWQPKSDAEPA